MRKVKTESSEIIYIKEKKGKYYPCKEKKFIFGIVSPSLCGLYSQEELKKGYETGVIKQCKTSPFSQVK